MQKDVHFPSTLAIMLASEVLSTYFVDSTTSSSNSCAASKPKECPCIEDKIKKEV
jgi:hypothetical protein